MKKITFINLTLALIFTFCAVSAKAQNTLSDEKRKLIGELIVLTKTDKQIVEITDTILKSMETTYPIALSQTIDGRQDLPAAEKEKLKASLKDSFQSFSQRFRERLPKAINYAQYVEETVYPLYDKFFSEQELRDLVAFYKTPTGKKVIETMPQLFAESTRLAEKNLLPKVLKLLDEMMQEDLQNYKSATKKSDK